MAVKLCGSELLVNGAIVKIAHLDTDRYDAVTAPEELVSELRKLPARADIFTFMQIMPDTEPRFSYPMEMDNLAILPVSTFENWWNHQIRSYPRNRARQAEKKGVILREVPFDDDLVRGIWEIYNETRVRQGRPSRHYGLDLDSVRRSSGTFLDRCIFIGALFEGRMIGFAKLVIDTTGMQAGLMSIEAMISCRDKAPSNALIAASVRACADRGIPYLMYQRMIYGNRDADTLAHFKQINGFEQVNLPRYFIPLTPLGKFALRCGLHRRFVDMLPNTMAANLLKLRHAWYNRKLRSDNGAA